MRDRPRFSFRFSRSSRVETSDAPFQHAGYFCFKAFITQSDAWQSESRQAGLGQRLCQTSLGNWQDVNFHSLPEPDILHGVSASPGVIPVHLPGSLTSYIQPGALPCWHGADSIQYNGNKRAHSFLSEPGKSESVLPKAYRYAGSGGSCIGHSVGQGVS